MLRADNIKIMLFAILCICFVFYLFLGVNSYNRNKKSRINVIFFVLCMSVSLWAIGCAFMLNSPNIGIANKWRLVSALGGCFSDALWISFVLSLKDINQKKSSSKVQYLLYIISIICFISNLIYEPSKVVSTSIRNLDLQN